MKPTRLLCAGLLAAALLTGCSNGQADQHAGHTEHMANGDLQETTASLTQLPSFLDNAAPEIKEVYKLSAANQDLLKTMPCYCGCGESAGHQHNGNCFIKEVKEDGTVVWDDHGTRCNVCMEITVYSVKLKQEGKTPLEIRSFIDQTYKEGYATPTATPLPS